MNCESDSVKISEVKNMREKRQKRKMPCYDEIQESAIKMASEMNAETSAIAAETGTPVEELTKELQDCAELAIAINGGRSEGVHVYWTRADQW